MHRLGGSGHIQEALHHREEGAAVAERLLWGEGVGPETALLTQVPLRSPSRQPPARSAEAGPRERRWGGAGSQAAGGGGTGHVVMSR